MQKIVEQMDGAHTLLTGKYKVNMHTEDLKTQGRQELEMIAGVYRRSITQMTLVRSGIVIGWVESLAGL